MVLQMVQGERMQHVLPLFVFKGEPVRLVLLVKQLAAAATSDAAGSTAAAAAAAAAGGSRMLYGGAELAAFDDVYGAVRALGPASWVGWVADAVAEMRRGFVRLDLAVGAGDQVAVGLRVAE
jgi:hypothetical protein